MASIKDLGCFLKSDGIALSSLVEAPLVRDRFKASFEGPVLRTRVAGLLTTVAYQKARLIAEKIHQHLPFKFSTPEIRGMLQVDWHEYITKMRRRVGGKIWKSDRQVLVFVNEEYIGNDEDFAQHLRERYVIRLPAKEGFYQNLVTEEFKQCIQGSGRDYVYFTFTVDNHTIGSFLFMLYSDLLPKTCKNFLDLCIGDYGETDDGVRLHYKNTIVHRIVKNGWLQCGDIELIQGGGGMATNGGDMPDESYCVPHNRRGVLSMANNGKHSNGSQFVVSLKPNPWMDHYYVAFGQLVDGVETLKRIEHVPTSYEKPLRRIVVARCGEYFFGEEPEMEAGPDLFFKHVSGSSSQQAEGECPSPCKYVYPGYPGLRPWLDNVADKLDDRDTISLLMAERYLGGLYSLATDYLPGMDMLPSEPRIKKPDGRLNLNMSKVCPKCDPEEDKEFSFNFDGTSEEQKISLVSEAGKEIVASALGACSDEASLERISMDGAGTAQWVLELACEIAAAALSRVKHVEREESSEDRANRSEDTLSEKAQKITAGLVTSEGISLVEDILKEALLHAVEVEKDSEDSERASDSLRN